MAKRPELAMEGRYKLTRLDQKLGLKAALLRLQSLVSDVHSTSFDSQLNRFEVEVHNTDILGFFGAQPTKIKTLWFSRDGDFKMTGFGTAFSLRDKLCKGKLTFQKIKQLLSWLGPEVHFFGGMRFDEGRRPDDAWSKFGGCRFVLPQVELKQVAGRLWLCINCWKGNETSKILSDIRSLLNNPLLGGGTSELTESIGNFDLLRNFCGGIRELPDAYAWGKNVDESLSKIEKGCLEKIVLARRKTLKFSRPLDPNDLIMGLAEKSQGAYLFYFRNEFGNCYLGASPERLYSRRHRRIESEAIAGTRERSQDCKIDRQLEIDLLNSQKDCLEQQLVCSEIERKLAVLCCDFGVVDDRKVIKLPNVQHLRTRFGGILKRDIDDWNIVDALHPTPAVCGLPSEEAFSFIMECEPFDRGCYAGPVGYIGKDHAEFAVGIRSALIEQENLHLFAGAGIVKGSNAKDEWGEIENKMRLFSDMFETREC